MTWYNERLYRLLRDSMNWRQNLSFFQFSDFVLNTLNLSIYKVSHCMKSPQYIERFNISSLSIYGDDLIQWETSYIERFNVLRTKSSFFSVFSFCPQYIESFNIWSLSLYEIISIYWETWDIESLKILRWLHTMSQIIVLGWTYNFSSGHFARWCLVSLP